MANRVYYPVAQVGFTTLGLGSYTAVHGVQSIGITTNFNLEQVFELSQLEIYENIENVPDIEVTMEKVLDGYPTPYLLGTKGATAADLAGRSAVKTQIAMSLFDDSQAAATGTPTSQVIMSGMYVSSASWTFPVDGNFSESTTWVGNSKIWRTTPNYAFSGVFNTTDSPVAMASGGVNRRENLLFTPTVSTLDVNSQVADPNCTILPGGTNGIPGLTSSGTNPKTGTDNSYAAILQNVSVSVDLGRDEIFQLGRRTPYYRFVTFPTEVTCDIEVLTLQGDKVDASEDGVLGNGTNLAEKSIRIATHEGLRLNLGTKNKLSSINQSGADTGGGNMTVTYSFSNFNALTVTHWNDPTTALAPAQGGTAN